jgi:lambda repressor-like predicted transcriptional regulator
MKKVYVLFLILWSVFIYGQNNDLDKKLRKVDQLIDSIIDVKSKSFQAGLDSINKRYQRNEINKKDADFLRKQLANNYGYDLDYAVFKLTRDLKRVSEGKAPQDSTKNHDLEFDIYRIILSTKSNNEKKRKEKKKKKKYSSLIVAIGINNTINNDDFNSIEHSPYKFWPSRYFELGREHKTNISNHWLFAKYGYSFVWNTLKPAGNEYHEVVNDTIQIITAVNELKSSKLRSIWFKIPVGLEINLPDVAHKHVTLSAGIYGRFRLTTKQKLSYADDNKRDEVIKTRYNMRNFVYGVSAEIGSRSWRLYANYDLNSLFINRNWQMLNFGLKLNL